MNATKTIPTATYIKEYLQLSTAEYEDIKLHRYWNWCAKYGKSPNHIQQLLADAAVNSWWEFQHNKLEKQFFDIYESLPKRTDTIDYYYQGIMVQLFIIYPKPLIDSIINKSIPEEVNFIKAFPNYYYN